MSESSNTIIRQFETITVSEFIEKFEGKTHPGFALVMSSRLETSLTQLIELYMQKKNRDLRDKIFRGYGPLSTFSSKIDVAFAFGLINSEDRLILDTVRSIRNAFAHTDEDNLTFDDAKIMKLIKKFPDVNTVQAGQIEPSNSLLYAHNIVACTNSLHTHYRQLIIRLTEFAQTKPSKPWPGILP
ncbi:hypothetical protein J0X15_19925 [Roseibium sp. CAU 1637]|uniref:Mannitol repressor n=1 Tax=Roseibium limicola TaxID=2816037 RepID=A0A939EUS7_9HYPH|nr:hypothetical protein [Roseibium limicola]